jgi:CheY-like chemotaxis protein
MSVSPCVVLVVDDEPAVLAVTALRLRRAGYDAVEASGGLGAVLILESRGGVCVVLSDCNMMPMKGAELAKVVLRRWPHIGYVAMSAEPPDPDLPDKVSFIHKPHSTAALVAAIEGERSAVAVRAGARPGTAQAACVSTRPSWPRATGGMTQPVRGAAMDELHPTTCPICEGPASEETHLGVGDTHTISCPACGPFRIADIAISTMLGLAPEHRRERLEETQRAAKPGELPSIIGSHPTHNPG